MTADDSSLPEVVTAESARARRRRIVIASAMGVAAVLVAGTVAAVDGGGKSNRVHVAAGTPTTSAVSTSTNESTSTSVSETTSPVLPSPDISFPDTAATTLPGTAAPTTTTLPPVAQTADLEATLTLAHTTLVAEQSATFSVRVRNVGDHRVDIRNLTVLIAVPDPYDPSPWDVIHDLATLDPGEERTFTGALTPLAETVGTWPLRPALTVPIEHFPTNGWTAAYLADVTPVTVTVVPPGYVQGDPLDPALSKWRATLSSDADRVRVGDAVTIHVTLKNVGTQLQTTSGYGSLEISCLGAFGHGQSWGHLIGAATLPAGAEQSFSVAFDPERGPGSATCQLDIVYHGAGLYAVDGTGITANKLSIDVMLADPSTTQPG